MQQDAETHAEEDKKRKEEIDTRNEADALTFRAQKALDEYKEKLPEAVTADIQSKIDDVKKALESNETEKIKTSMEDLNTHMQRIGEEMQKAAGAAGAAPGAEEAAGAAPQQEEPQSEDNIEEAEVEILDKNDK